MSKDLNIGGVQLGYNPHYLDEYENKGLAKCVPRKCMKIKCELLLRYFLDIIRMER